jgi:hypothetical protein
MFSGAGTPAASPSGTGSPVSAVQATPGPGTKVTPTLDDKDLVDALIPAKGGQIHLTLPNGMAYNLNIPDGALMNDQEISMVPITRIDGMRLSGGLIGGVQLEPEGLELLAPATLTITVPKGYDPKQMVGFGYHAGGDGFHLDLATGDGKTISLSIDSFSGHGAASGTPGSIADQGNQPAGSPADTAAQQLTNAIKQCVGQDDSQCLPLIQMLIDQYNNTIKPDLTAAQNDDSKIDSAAGEFLNWWHDVELLSLDREITINGKTYNIPGLIDKGKALVFKGLKNAFDQESARCLSQEDISQSTKMFNRLRQLALLSDDTQPPYTMETKWKDFEKCARYRMNFESKLTWKMGESMTIKADIKGSAILRLDGEGEYQLYSTRNGSGTLTYNSFDADFSGASEALNNYCKIDATDSSGKLQAAMKIATQDKATGNFVVNPVVIINPTALSQNLPKWVCQTGSGTLNISDMAPELPLWQSGFYDLHKDLQMGDYENKGYTIANPYWFTQDFTPGDGVYHLGTLQLHSTATSEGSTAEEDLTIDIVGAPGATQ